MVYRMFVFVALLNILACVPADELLTLDDCVKPCMTPGQHCMSYSCIRKRSMVRCELNGISAVIDKGASCVSPGNVQGLKHFCQQILNMTENFENLFANSDWSSTTIPHTTTPLNVAEKDVCISVSILVGVALSSFASGLIIMWFCCFLLRNRCKELCGNSQKEHATIPSVYTTGSRTTDTRRILLSTESTDSGLSTSNVQTPVLAIPNTQFEIARSRETASVDPTYISTNRSVSSRQEGHDYESILNSDYQESGGASGGSFNRSLIRIHSQTLSSNYEDLGRRERPGLEDHDYASMCEEETLSRKHQHQVMATKKTEVQDYLGLQPVPTRDITGRNTGGNVDAGTARDIPTQNQSDLNRNKQHEYYVLEKEGAQKCMLQDPIRANVLSTSPAAHSYLDLNL